MKRKINDIFAQSTDYKRERMTKLLKVFLKMDNIR